MRPALEEGEELSKKSLSIMMMMRMVESSKNNAANASAVAPSSSSTIATTSSTLSSSSSSQLSEQKKDKHKEMLQLVRDLHLNNKKHGNRLLGDFRHLEPKMEEMDAFDDSFFPFPEEEKKTVPTKTTTEENRQEEDEEDAKKAGNNSSNSSSNGSMAWDTNADLFSPALADENVDREKDIDKTKSEEEEEEEPADEKNKEDAARFHNEMLQSFLKRNGQDEQIASAMAEAFGKFLKNNKNVLLGNRADDGETCWTESGASSHLFVDEEEDDSAVNNSSLFSSSAVGENEFDNQEDLFAQCPFPTTNNNDKDINSKTASIEQPQQQDFGDSWWDDAALVQNNDSKQAKVPERAPPLTPTFSDDGNFPIPSSQRKRNQRKPTGASQSVGAMPHLSNYHQQQHQNFHQLQQQQHHHQAKKGILKKSSAVPSDNSSAGSVSLDFFAPLNQHRPASRASSMDLSTSNTSFNSAPAVTTRIPRNDSFISRASRIDAGASYFTAQPERTIMEQLASLSIEDRRVVFELKSRWESSPKGKGVELPMHWYLRFARCCPGRPFTLDNAWKSMKRFRTQYLNLNIRSLEKQILTGTIFPVPGLRSIHGHDMFYMRPRRYFPKRTPVDVVVNNLVYVMQCMLEKEHACSNGIGLVANMDDWTMANFSVHFCHKFLMALQGRKGYSPTRVQMFLIVNPPLWFGNIWKIMKPMLTPDFRQKVHMISVHQMPKYLEPGFEQHLPIDMYPGRIPTGRFIHGFIEERKRAESKRILTTT